MSRVFIIQDVRGEHRLGEADFPIVVGGAEQGDIVIAGVPAEAVIAHIAFADGHAFIQPADAGELFHNHEFVSGSTWLKSGDEVQFDDSVLLWQVQGDQVFITTRRRATETTLVPPLQPPPAVTDQPPPNVPPDVVMATPVTQAHRKGRWAAFVVFSVLLLATAFVLLATPVAVIITPAPAQQSLQGFPPAVTVGKRLLALPGRYMVNAQLQGYQSLQQTVTVNMGGLQEFQLQLEPLPGLVQIELDPAVDYRVYVDEQAVETGADAITEMRAAITCCALRPIVICPLQHVWILLVWDSNSNSPTVCNLAGQRYSWQVSQPVQPCILMMSRWV